MRRSLLIALYLAPSLATADSPAYKGLGAESVSQADISRFAPPPLASTVTRRIQAMLDVRGAPTGLVTGKGDRMFFTSTLTGTAQVWRQDGPMKFPVQLTGGEDRTVVVALSPDEKWLAVSRDIGGEENPGLYLMDPSGGALRVVQHVPKVQTTLEYISDDSKTLVYRANDRDPASYTLYRYDVATKQKELVFDQPGLWGIADHAKIAGKETWLLVKRLGNTHVEIYRYDVASKQLTPLLGQTESEDYAVRFGARPGQVLVRTNKLGEFHRLYSLDNGKLTPISRDVAHDVDGFSIDEPRTRIYYQVNEDGYARLYALDAKTLKPLALPKLPEAENVAFGGASRNGRYIQLSVDGSRLPGTSVTYDWKTRKAVTWRVPMTPEVDPSTFAKATLEHYPTRDGKKIPMFVRRPASCAAPCPVVVEFHGGPEGQATAGFSPIAQLYVDAGFVFVQPNVRGSEGYGKSWLHADNGPKRLQVITDIEDAAKYIRAAWSKDGKAPKIGVIGGSYGGYSTLMAMTYFAGAYDAGVQTVGISNLYTFLMNTAPYRRILRASEYGDPVKDKNAIVQLSPITHVTKIKAPLLSIQGVNDPRVPVGEALQIYKALERRKVPGGLILFADEGHGVSKRSNRVLAIGHTLAFLEKHLANK
ncbi:MAG TPA: prolyl oligopeptidase family serine peptidase [Kofleriaceae bacterium]|nr:prolyl oligopeptidase family serine peptidase [Kofleriaceae bacterium]